MHPDHCPNCDAGGGRVVYTAPAFDNAQTQSTDYYTLTLCPHCNLVSTRGVTEDDLTEAYHPDYYGGENKFTGVMERLLSLLARNRARTLTRYFRQGYAARKDIPPSVLDIGCGRGILLKAFQQLGAEVQGVEREACPLDPAIKANVHIGSIEDAEMQAGPFNIIVLWHVMEHLRKPDSLLDTLQGIVADQGLVVIAVPNFASIQQDLFGPAWFHLDLPRHLLHLTPDWLESRLVERGFVVEQTSHTDYVQNTFGFIQSVMNRCFPQKRNAFYEMLKHQGKLNLPMKLASIFAWGMLATLLLPLALIESLVGAFLKKGATIQIIARKI